MYPLTFHPRFKERVWGGRRLETLYGKALPPDVPIGESWEISDLPGDESVVANGALAGRTLRWLMTEHRQTLLGSARAAPDGRFPLLCKILDAREKLSLQVHPPAARAAELGGEPKTEMWFIAEAEEGAELFVGLRRGVTREAFEAGARAGDVAGLFHRLAVCSGDAMFLPSGRVHAIGAGLVIFEIQQSSDTTYRVFDWNRKGLDGRPRELHLPQSLASIDFDDVEPSLIDARLVEEGSIGRKALVRDPLFHVDLCETRGHGAITVARGTPTIVAVTSGRVIAAGGGVPLPLRAGDFALLPASLSDASITFEPDSRFLTVVSPS